MARKDGKAETQHYVPQVLLKNFSTKGRGKEWQVSAFDKHSDRAFRAAIGKVAAERQYYDVKFSNVNFSLEGALSLLEGKVEGVIDKIISSKSLSSLNDDDKGWLSAFVACQYARVPNQMRAHRDVDEAIKEKIVASGGDPKKVKGYRPFESDDEAKAFALSSIETTIGHLWPIIRSKVWMLLEDPRDGFWIGDCPVVLHNHEDFGPYGNIGFAVPFVEVYLPLSGGFTLALWCPQFIERLKDANKTMTMFRGNFSGRYARAKPIVNDEIGFEEIERQLRECERILPHNNELLLAIETGSPLKCSAENVEYQNSLQGMWANRFVFGREENFDLLKRMINDREEVRFGKRIAVN